MFRLKKICSENEKAQTIFKMFVSASHVHPCLLCIKKEKMLDYFFFFYLSQLSVQITTRTSAVKIW